MFMMKTIKQICLVATVCVMGSSVVMAAEVGQATGASVNLRSSASTEASVLAKIDKGDEYTVVNKSGNWFEISYSGETGFVHHDYFELTKADATVTGSNVNVRQAANTSATVLGKLENGASVTLTGKADGWYRISYNDTNAYIAADYVTGDNLNQLQAVAATSQGLENTYGVVTASTGLKFRKEASTISTVLTVLSYGTEVDVDRVGTEWVRIILDDGTKGYVSAEYLSIKTGERTVANATSVTNASSSKGADMIAYAKQFIGTPYVWGGTSLTSGVDCSGFVYAVYKNYGITLNRSSYTMVSHGTEVAKANLQAGDLVFFNSGGTSRINHVGIYMGDGNYIHSTDGAAYGVTTTSLSSSYSAKTYVTARRVLS